MLDNILCHISQGKMKSKKKKKGPRVSKMHTTGHKRQIVKNYQQVRTHWKPGFGPIIRKAAAPQGPLARQSFNSTVHLSEKKTLQAKMTSFFSAGTSTRHIYYKPREQESEIWKRKGEKKHLQCYLNIFVTPTSVDCDWHWLHIGYIPLTITQVTQCLRYGSLFLKCY